VDKQEATAEIQRLLQEGGKENRRRAEDLSDEHDIVVYDKERNLSYFPNMDEGTRRRYDELVAKKRAADRDEGPDLSEREWDELYELGYPLDNDEAISLRGLWISSSMRC
jgi:hypothetical protein